MRFLHKRVLKNIRFFYQHAAARLAAVARTQDGTEEQRGAPWPFADLVNAHHRLGSSDGAAAIPMPPTRVLVQPRRRRARGVKAVVVEERVLHGCYRVVLRLNERVCERRVYGLRV